MPLKELVELAIKSYSKPEPLFEELKCISEEKLPDAIVALAANPRIGKTLRKNLVDILYIAVQVKRREITFEKAKTDIGIFEIQGKKYLTPWLSKPDYTNFENFIRETNIYILGLTPKPEAKDDYVMVGEKKSHLTETKEEIQQLKVDLENSRKKEEETKQKTAELEEKYKQLQEEFKQLEIKQTELIEEASKLQNIHAHYDLATQEIHRLKATHAEQQEKSAEDILKLQYREAFATQEAKESKLALAEALLERDRLSHELKTAATPSISDDETSFSLIRCIKREHDLEKNYTLLTRKTDDINRVYQSLYRIYSRYIENPQEVELPDESIKSLSPLQSRDAVSLFKYYSIELSPESLFYSKAREILEDLLNTLSKLGRFSKRDVEMCRSIIQILERNHASSSYRPTPELLMRTC